MGDRGQTLVPTRYQVRTGPFLIYSNTPIATDSPAIRCLHALETDLTTHLGYHSRAEEEPVEIYVLGDRNAYTHFLKFYYPELPPRRAFFLAQGDRRVVYTYLSDRLEEDLRHEATHALLRGCYGDLPLWLDEGLAEYFETHPDAIDAQDEHLDQASRRPQAGMGSRPCPAGVADRHPPDDPARLSRGLGLGSPDARRQPGGQAAAARLPEPGPHRRAEPAPFPDSRRARDLGQDPGGPPRNGAVQRAGPVARAPSRDRLIRFQDHPAELQDRAVEPAVTRVAPAPAPRPSFLRRIGAFFGL